MYQNRDKLSQVERIVYHIVYGITAIFMKKNIIIGALLLIIGFVIGLLCRPEHFRDEMKMFQTDTIVRFDTIKYSKLELIGKDYKLDLPKIAVPKLTFLNVEKIDTVYKDNVMYMTYPRENYYTSVKDVEIWYSGIDSTIDSLNVVAKNVVISKTETTTQTIRHSNRLRLGIEANYCSTLSTPIYLEYERMLQRNFGISARFFYDLPTRMYGVGIGVNVQVGW